MNDRRIRLPGGLSNHCNLLIQTLEGRLVAVMNWPQNTYTCRLNIRHRLCGNGWKRGHICHILPPLFPGASRLANRVPKEQKTWMNLSQYAAFFPFFPAVPRDY